MMFSVISAIMWGIVRLVKMVRRLINNICGKLFLVIRSIRYDWDLMELRVCQNGLQQ
jgi:hypothetical protein